MLLPYESEILEECRKKSCILVMAQGLGIERIIWYIARTCTAESSLQLLLNFTEDEIEYYKKQGSSSFYDLRAMTIKQRQALYSEGGVFAASSRVFMTDILSGVIKKESVTSVLVNHLEELRENCTEAFLVHFLRKTNKGARVRGFTEKSNVLSCGVTFLEEIMLMLKVDAFFLYPRFHKTVQNSLGSNAEVVEMKFKLGTELKEIQVLLVDIVKSLLSGVNREEGMVADYETALSSEFSEVLRVGRYGWKTRRLDCDLRKIKKLLKLLYSTDFGLFYAYYRVLLEEQLGLQEDATWASLPSAHLLLEKMERLAVVCANKITSTSLGVESRYRCSSMLMDKLEKEHENVHGHSLGSKMSFEEVIRNSKCKPELSDIEILERYKEKGLGRKDTCGDAEEEQKELLEEERICKGPQKKMLNYKLSTCLEILKSRPGKKVCVLSSLKETAEVAKILISSSLSFPLFLSLTHYKFRFVEDSFDIIILIDPNIASIRKIEADSSRHKAAAETILMYYIDSLEEQRNLSEIRDEKYSFEKLISKKSKLALNLSREHRDEIFGEGKKILIDTREMRSSLPFCIYKAKSKIEVRTLEVGDYILSESICVERKAIFDFISSIISGRMYSQLKMASFRYRYPTLLLEFERNKRPCISDYLEHKKENFLNSILSRFMLLLLKFPTLRIIWSNSDLTTVKVFRSLQEKDKNKLTDLGTHKNSFCHELESLPVDPVLQELLMSIDGVDLFNYKKIVRNFRNLRELSNAGLENLHKVLGAEKGCRVYTFFNKKI